MTQYDVQRKPQDRAADLDQGVATSAVQRRLAHYVAEFHSGLDGWIPAGGSSCALSLATLTGLVR